jgi:hypothetical protein
MAQGLEPTSAPREPIDLLRAYRLQFINLRERCDLFIFDSE